MKPIAAGLRGVTCRYLPALLLGLSLLVSAAACNSRPATGPAPTAAAMLSNAPAGAGEPQVPPHIEQKKSFVNPHTSSSTAPTTEPSGPVAVSLKRSLTYIASDTLQGRGLGSEGLDLAAAYIAGRYEGAGLVPAPGMSDYFQRFEWATADGIAPDTRLAIAGNSLKIGDEYNPLSFSGEKSFDAPAVFVGYGITSKEHNYDDYAGVDVKGKVVVAWRFEPADANGKSQFTHGDWSTAAHLDTKAQNAIDHGAVALVLANPPRLKELDTLLPFTRTFTGSSVSIPVVHVKRAVVAPLLKQATGMEPIEVQQAIEKGPAPKSFKLDVNVSGNVAVKRTTRYLQNVVAMLPGAGPHANEYVVVGAHYDHLGRGGFGSLMPLSHEIHNGADDNGSGTVTILELAKELAEAKENGHPLARSVIFVSFTAEEEGLIGSAQFVSHPPVPLEKVVAMLNIDMVGRLRDNTLLIGGSGTAPSFERILNEAAPKAGIQWKDIGKGGMGPSDHMSFALKKVPVLFFFTGIHRDYHTPGDKVSKVNFNGMAEVVDFGRDVIEAMAAMPKEQYVTAADKFSMSMGLGDPSGVGAGGSGGPRASLGVVPNYVDSESTKGVPISGTTEGTAASKAGLKDGDVLTGFNDKKLDNLMDLSTALAGAKPGDKVKIKLLRDGKEMTVDVTLGERK